jgi:dihydroflavonol-4-reductase
LLTGLGSQVDFVTGATGFIGSHIVRALLASGRVVRCLVRPASPRRNLDGLRLDLAEGDLGNPSSLEKSLRGIDVVYHCAADYRLWSPDPRELYRNNVEGTDNLLRAAAEAGVRRIVYTSSVGALAPGGPSSLTDEATPVRLEQLVGHYKRSKYLAERCADAWVARGLPVVIVNPSTPVGEGDIKPTPTGQIVVDFLNRRLPAYVDTGLNLVDVRDVAMGHLLAAERGRPGQRYILGHRNISLRDLFLAMEGISGLPAPSLRLPHFVPIAFAAAATALARVRGRPPRVSFEAARLARHYMFFEGSKAVRELGMPQSPIESALGRAMIWFCEEGYVQQPAAPLAAARRAVAGAATPAKERPETRDERP